MDAALQLCEALRFLVKAGVVDYNGHASGRVPEGFLINAAASNRAAPTAAQLCVVTEEGELVRGDRPPNEVHLHAAIYRARPDVDAVVHGHPPWLCTLSSAGRAIEPVMPQAAVLGTLPVYPHAHSISTRGRAEAVAALLGSAKGAVLRGHGIVTAAPDLLTACVLAHYAEQTAERQVRAAPLGGARPLDPEEAEEYGRTLLDPALLRKCWDFTLARQEA